MNDIEQMTVYDLRNPNWVPYDEQTQTPLPIGPPALRVFSSDKCWVTVRTPNGSIYVTEAFFESCNWKRRGKWWSVYDSGVIPDEDVVIAWVPVINVTPNPYDIT